MAKINGTNLTILVNTGDGSGLQAVAFARTCKCNVEMQESDATTKDSAGWDERIMTNGKWDLSSDGLMDFNPSNSLRNVKALFDALAAKTQVSIRFGIGGTNISEVTGDQRWTGNAFITKLEMNGSDKEVATYSVTIIGNGALTRAQV